MATAQKLADTAAPEPELEPQGLRSREYGFLVCPPRLLHPLTERVDLKFAHSLRLVFPKRMAPAARSLATKNASCVAILSCKASAPAVVCILSPVSILSFIKTGTPCKGPRVFFCFRSASHCLAMANASGLSSMTAFKAGPFLL